MIPHLPVEILRLIVNNFRLPLFSSYRRTPELENETRATLCALSLTSHTLRQIAQPLLYEFIRLRDKQQLSQLVQNNSSNDLLEHLRSLVFAETFNSIHSIGSPALRSFAPRLEQLIGYGYEGISHWLYPPPSGRLILFIDMLGVC
jgi:hypothetical protein